jgi:hypothetical protein
MEKKCARILLERAPSEPDIGTRVRALLLEESSVDETGFVCWVVRDIFEVDDVPSGVRWIRREFKRLVGESPCLPVGHDRVDQAVDFKMAWRRALSRLR